MNRRTHALGRGLTSLGLASTATYLAWRVATLPSRPPLWLVALAIVIEVTGFVGSGLLAWALWRIPKRVPDTHGYSDTRDPVDVVVRVERQPIHDIRATLLALHSTSAAGRWIVVDLLARSEVRALAAEFDAVYAPITGADRNGLKVCSASSATPFFLLLDAGDVPSGDAIARLLPLMRDDRVAVAIAQSLMADDDSAEHGPNGLHELGFDRCTLNPALGARGASILADSGALVRRVAVDNVGVGDEQAIEALACWSMALMANGWKVVAASGAPVLARQVVESQDTVYEQRVVRARAARVMTFGPDGILRWNSLRLGQRMAIAASAVRPLSGLRRGGFLAVVVGSLLTGTLPLRADVKLLAALWTPGWLFTALGLWLMSGWTLRPGDRTRWSLRNLGASFQGLRRPIADEQRRAPIMTPHALQHGGALVASVVVLGSVMMLRGVSEQWTHALGAMPYPSLIGLLVVALWSLAMALDVLRMFARRNKLRRAARLVASIPAEVNDHPVAVFDITALGAGFEINHELSTRQELALDATITTSRGCENVSVPIRVRNVRQVSEDRWRVGVEYVVSPSHAINALIEYCMVEPARRRLSHTNAVSALEFALMAEPVTRPALDGRRVALRLISLLAVGGAIASAHPGQGSMVSSMVSAASIVIAGGVLAGAVRPRRSTSPDAQSTSSPSPDLAMR